MKNFFVILAAAGIFAGCSSEQAARKAFNAFSINCDRNTFSTEIRQEGNVKTFTSTCKTKN